MLDDADRLAVALTVLRRKTVVDAEAVAAVLVGHWPADVVAYGVTRGLGSVCNEAGACTLAATVDAERKQAAVEMLTDAGLASWMSDSLTPR